jgi:hypothetical protein
MGVICHESSHFIFEMLYENGAMPFRKDDKVIRENFEAIVRDLFNHRNELDEIIDRVFKYYGEATINDEQPIEPVLLSEMIVRVIQLEIFYKEDQQRLNEIKSIPCVRALFDFYEQVVEKDIEARLKTTKNELLVKEVNRLDGLVSEIRKFQVKIEDHVASKLGIKRTSCNLVVSNCPKLTLINVHQISSKRRSETFNNCSDVFVKIENLMNEEFLLKVERAKSLNPDRFLVVDCSTGLSVYQIKEIERVLKSLSRTIFITKSEIK